MRNWLERENRTWFTPNWLGLLTQLNGAAWICGLILMKTGGDGYREAGAVTAALCAAIWAGVWCILKRRRVREGDSIFQEYGNSLVGCMTAIGIMIIAWGVIQVADSLWIGLSCAGAATAVALWAIWTITRATCRVTRHPG